MESVICAKLDSCSEFRDALMATGTTKLVEATTRGAPPLLFREGVVTRETLPLILS